MIKDREIKVKRGKLPKFCIAAGSAGSKHPSRSKYEKYYGPIFIHVHHFCRGLDKINIANRTNDKKILGRSIYEFDYVLNKPDPKKRMNYKVAYAKGGALLMLNDRIGAMKSFYRSIKLNKKFPAGYIALSNVFMQYKNKQKACEILKIGLKNNPDSANFKAYLENICSE